uniref:Ig-like domain-containing protein n=1 Tax=Astyanax mexicanus TaxID=7994 RepID=A0A3B1IN06_ASTMX
MSAVKVEQNPTLFASKAATAVIPCSHNNDSSYNYVFWYQQKSDSTTMDLIGYTIGTGKPIKEKGFNDRFQLNRLKTTEGNLTISDLSQSDSAVYYCVGDGLAKYVSRLKPN